MTYVPATALTDDGKVSAYLDDSDSLSLSGDTDYDSDSFTGVTDSESGDWDANGLPEGEREGYKATVNSATKAGK